jgi:hypothetical protein
MLSLLLLLLLLLPLLLMLLLLFLLSCVGWWSARCVGSEGLQSIWPPLP